MSLKETYIDECLDRARYFEYCKDTGKALESLEPFWNNFEDPPDISGLSPDKACQLLIVAGGIISLEGMMQQRKDSQLLAENILTRARDIALNLNDIDLVAETEKQIGVAYWREGRYENAIAFLNSVQSHYSEDEQNEKTICLLAKVNLISLLLKTKKRSKAFEMTILLESVVEANGNLWLKTSYYNQAGILYHYFNHFRKSIECLEKAVYFARKTENKAYMANAYNNLAVRFIAIKEFDTALDKVERALNLFTELNQPTAFAQALETKAQVLIKKGHLDVALTIIDESIRILQEGENHVFLAESLWRKLTVFHKSKNTKNVLKTFTEIVEIAGYLDEQFVAKYIDKFEDLIYLKDTENSLIENTNNFKRHLMEKALTDFNGVVISAAENLKINQNHLISLLADEKDIADKFDIPIDRYLIGAEVERSAKKIKTALRINSDRLEDIGIYNQSIVTIKPLPFSSLDLELPVLILDQSGELQTGFLFEEFGMLGFGKRNGEIERALLKDEVQEFFQIKKYYCEKKQKFISLKKLLKR